MDFLSQALLFKGQGAGSMASFPFQGRRVIWTACIQIKHVVLDWFVRKHMQACCENLGYSS